jgi:hypothetical protein
MDPRRRGEYQGVADVSHTLGSMWAPALYTFLALSWGSQGWLVIGGIVVTASICMAPAVRMAERFTAQHFPAELVEESDPTAPAELAEPITATDPAP